MLQHRSKFHDITTRQQKGWAVFHRSKGKDKHSRAAHKQTFLLIPAAHRSFCRIFFPASAHNLSKLGRYSSSWSREKPTNQFSQPEVVEVVLEAEAMNMVKPHLSQTLALSMRTKLKANHMLSTAVSIRGPALVNVLARMQESNLGCGMLDSTKYTLKISYDK